MSDTEDVALEVPELVQAIYLVPVNGPPPEPAAILNAIVPDEWEIGLGAALANLPNGPLTPVEVRPTAEIPPLPVELLAAMGASDEQLERVNSANHFVLATLQGQPGWPPAHEWIARAVATVAAEQVGSDVVDILNYQVLTTATARRTLPDASGRVRLADWIWVDHSADSTGYWCTTTGLRRFGLPELQTLAAPPHVVEAWGRVMTGLSHRVLGLWSERLTADREAAFVQLPALVEITRDDVAVAYGRPATGTGGGATVRLALDPGANPDGHPFLTIHPPLSWAGSAGEHIAGVCAALFGVRAGGVRHAPPSDVMDRAMATARAGLSAIRERFESGDLDLHEKLLVKYALTAEAGTEYLWAYVTSWRDEDRVLATSAADAIYHPKVRAGRPVVVDAGTIVDWAVEHDDLGIVEGGWTQAALDANGA
jgi:hypothetical protein